VILFKRPSKGIEEMVNSPNMIPPKKEILTPVKSDC